MSQCKIPVSPVSGVFCHGVTWCHLVSVSVGAAISIDVSGQTVSVLTSAVVAVAVLPLHGPVAVSLT